MRADPNPIGEMDKETLETLKARHPRSAITVTHGYFDGTDGRPFGYVPHDWDGTRVVYTFRMVPRPILDRAKE